jgi:two-component system alkaline phosphatase synthesis response regulator PhoP
MKQKLKVFIVDDNQDLVEESQEMLEDNGCQVYALTSSIEAAKKIKEVMPDVVMLDLKMPGKSGFELAQELKKDKQLQKIPIIGISAFYHDYFGLLRATGFDKFLVKPLDPQQLIEALNETVQ